MTPTETIAAYIRRAKAAERRARIADFQMRVQTDRTVLVNLKTGNVRIFPAKKERFADYCDHMDPSSELFR